MYRKVSYGEGGALQLKLLRRVFKIRVSELIHREGRGPARVLREGGGVGRQHGDLAPSLLKTSQGSEETSFLKSARVRARAEGEEV